MLSEMFIVFYSTLGHPPSPRHQKLACDWFVPVGQNGTELENHSSSEDDEKHEKTSEDITEKIDDEDAKRLCSKRQLRAERESKVSMY